MSAIETETCSAVTILEDRYVLGALLGEGAMGRVFAARDLILGIDVAVKIMRAELAVSRRQVALFTSEARIASRMLSRHVVRVLGIAVTRSNLPCIIYELLDGETLGQRIARNGGVSVLETVEIVKQVARALSRAHQIGVVHRDVKPDNIFLTRDVGGRMLVKLLDFGIAAEADKTGMYSKAQLAGTPEYMAPEMLFGTHDLDHRVDLYALGAVVYECLTGTVPFAGELIDLVEALRNGDRPSFTAHRPDLAGEVDTFLDRALHPEPYWRFSSAREMSDAFDKATRPAALSVSQAARITMRAAA